MKKNILLKADYIDNTAFPKIICQSNDITFQRKASGFLDKALLVNLLQKKSLSFFTNKDKFTIVLQSFQKILKNKRGYFLEIFLYGLNFHAKRIKIHYRPFYIDVHRSITKIFYEANDSGYRTRIYKRRLLFFTFQKKKFDAFFNILRPYRLFNRYTGKGLLFRGDKYKRIDWKKKKKKR